MSADARLTQARLAASDGLRPGEVALGAEPDPAPASLYFIGRIFTPWATRAECPTAGRSRGALVPGRDRGTLDARAFRHRSLRAPSASLLDASRTPRSRAPEPASWRSSPWHLRAALARSAEPDRLLDRGARARRGLEPLRARPRLRQRHAAHRHQARALPARLTERFRPPSRDPCLAFPAFASSCFVA